ncbi:MAG: DUF4013 domain-containing protein [Akkermansiaceae bacterium]|nr:DUF4013 domain-containing protein [Akkermansiaceae bacterium]
MDATLNPPPLPEPKGSGTPARSDGQGKEVDPHCVTSLVPERAGVPLPGKARRLLLHTWRVLKCQLLGTLGCLSIPGAVLLFGWTCRLVQRNARGHWARRLDEPRPDPRRLPRWIVSEDFRGHLEALRGGGFRNGVRRFFAAFLGSLGANLRTGFLVVLNSMILTLPGGLIMLFSWYSGWDNSFNKGYEQFAVGPILGWLGILLFIAAMTYVPVAQARQAVTGSAKAFFNYRKVRDVIHRRPVACLALVAIYTLCGAIFMVASSILMFAGNGWEALETMTNEQIISFLNGYHFWWAFLFIFPAFVILKLIAGRIYAGAAFDAVSDGSWKKEDLRGAEAEALAKVPVRPNPPALPGLMRAGLKTFGFFGRSVLRVGTFLLLLVFVFEIYIAQFFNFQPASRWLRHPMVQLPWYHDVPGALKE